MNERQNFWFPAKRCGWGWGLPCAWQGWVVLSVYVALVMAAAALIPEKGTWWFNVAFMILSLGLIGVCWLKGERPKRRR